MMASKGARRGSSQASFVGFDDGTQANHCGLVGRADGMDDGCAPLGEVLIFKRCRHQISPLRTMFGSAGSAGRQRADESPEELPQLIRGQIGRFCNASAWELGCSPLSC